MRCRPCSQSSHPQRISKALRSWPLGKGGLGGVSGEFGKSSLGQAPGAGDKVSKSLSINMKPRWPGW